MGKRVAVMGGGMYGGYRAVPAMNALPLPEGATSRDGASCFVNPLTALCFVETMRGEGHTALVHTAAASNLGQMLNRICQGEGIDIVNIVRKSEQIDLLKGMGAKYIVNSSDPDFQLQLTDAIHATGATLGFDAIGGGDMASKILLSMEAAAAIRFTALSRISRSILTAALISLRLFSTALMAWRGAWADGSCRTSSPRREWRQRCVYANASRLSYTRHLPAIIRMKFHSQRRSMQILCADIMRRKQARSSSLIRRLISKHEHRVLSQIFQSAGRSAR